MEKKYKLTNLVKRDNLVIPKGYRLIEDWELLKLSRTDKTIKKLLNNGWLWCNTQYGVRATGLCYDDDEFRILGGSDINAQGRSRGVLIKK